MSKVASVRELVRAIETELRDPDLPIGRVADHAMSLTSLLSSINGQARASEIAYKRVLVAKRAETKSAKDAELQAEVTQEYADWMAAKDMKEAVVELIRTLRKALETLREEARLAR